MTAQLLEDLKVMQMLQSVTKGQEFISIQLSMFQKVYYEYFWVPLRFFHNCRYFFRTPSPNPHFLPRACMDFKFEPTIALLINLFQKSSNWPSEEKDRVVCLGQGYPRKGCSRQLRVEEKRIFEFFSQKVGRPNHSDPEVVGVPRLVHERVDLARQRVYPMVNWGAKEIGKSCLRKS